MPVGSLAARRRPPPRRVFAWLRWVDATFSTYRADSEICRLDRGDARARPTPSRSSAPCWSAASACASAPAASSTSGRAGAPRPVGRS